MTTTDIIDFLQSDKIGIKQTIEDEFGGRVDVVRMRDNMNRLLRKRILQDIIYV